MTDQDQFNAHDLTESLRQEQKALQHGPMLVAACVFLTAICVFVTVIAALLYICG